MVQCVKKHIITIVAASLVVIAVLVTVAVVVFKNSKKNEEDDQGKGVGSSIAGTSTRTNPSNSNGH